MILGIIAFLNYFAEEYVNVPESSKASIDRSEEDSPHEGIIRHAGKKQDNKSFQGHENKTIISIMVNWKETGCN